MNGMTRKHLSVRMHSSGTHTVTRLDLERPWFDVRGPAGSDPEVHYPMCIDLARFLNGAPPPAWLFVPRAGKDGRSSESGASVAETVSSDCPMRRRLSKLRNRRDGSSRPAPSTLWRAGDGRKHRGRKTRGRPETWIQKSNGPRWTVRGSSERPSFPVKGSRHTHGNWSFPRSASSTENGYRARVRNLEPGFIYAKNIRKTARFFCRRRAESGRTEIDAGGVIGMVSRGLYGENRDKVGQETECPTKDQKRGRVCSWVSTLWTTMGSDVCCSCRPMRI